MWEKIKSWFGFADLNKDGKITAEDLEVAKAVVENNIKEANEKINEVVTEVLIIKPEQMVSNLFEDNNRVLASLQLSRNVADEYKQNGLVNFLEERLDQHNKHAWMLRASMK